MGVSCGASSSGKETRGSTGKGVTVGVGSGVADGSGVLVAGMAVAVGVGGVAVTVGGAVGGAAVGVSVGSGPHATVRIVRSTGRNAKRIGGVGNRRAACTRAAGKGVVGIIKRRTRSRFSITVHYKAILALDALRVQDPASVFEKFPLPQGRGRIKIPWQDLRASRLLV